MLRYWLLLYLLIISFCFDILLTFIVKRRGLLVNNIYFQLNVKYGYIKVSLLKGAFVIIQSWFLIDHGLSNSRIELVVVLYFLLIVKLFIDVLKSDNSNIKNETRN